MGKNEKPYCRLCGNLHTPNEPHGWPISNYCDLAETAETLLAEYKDSKRVNDELRKILKLPD